MKCKNCNKEGQTWPIQSMGGHVLCRSCMLAIQAEIAETLAMLDTPVLKTGAKGWYVDREEGIFEPAIVDEPRYSNGELESFGLDFPASKDWDEFQGSALGHVFFLTEEGAWQKWNEKGGAI